MPRLRLLKQSGRRERDSRVDEDSGYDTEKGVGLFADLESKEKLMRSVQ